MAARQTRRWNAVKVFTATGHFPRNDLGGVVTQWLLAHPRVEVAEWWVTQSSAYDIHCVSLTLFYWKPA